MQSDVAFIEPLVDECTLRTGTCGCVSLWISRSKTGNVNVQQHHSGSSSAAEIPPWGDLSLPVWGLRPCLENNTQCTVCLCKLSACELCRLIQPQSSSICNLQDANMMETLRGNRWRSAHLNRFLPQNDFRESSVLQVWSCFRAAMKDFLITHYFMDYLSIFQCLKIFFTISQKLQWNFQSLFCSKKCNFWWSKQKNSKHVEQNVNYFLVFRRCKWNLGVVHTCCMRNVQVCMWLDTCLN